MTSTFHQTVARLAGVQHGVVTRRQLVQSGVSPDVIDRRIRDGLLRTMHRGVFLASLPEPLLAREMAACLACGEHAFVSHRSAAAMWGIVKQSDRPSRPEIMLAIGYRRRPGIEVRRTSSLADGDTQRLRGIPITSAPRTLLDLAARLAPRSLERAVAQAFALRLVTGPELMDVADRNYGRRRARLLRSVLSGAGSPFTRSEAEERFLDLVRRSRVEPPQGNSRVIGFEVDFYWPQRQLVVEVDGRAFHSSPADFERDRARDAELAAVGIRVIRITWRQLTSSPEAILIRLGGALSASALR